MNVCQFSREFREFSCSVYVLSILNVVGPQIYRYRYRSRITPTAPELLTSFRKVSREVCIATKGQVYWTEETKGSFSSFAGFENFHCDGKICHLAAPCDFWHHRCRNGLSQLPRTAFREFCCVWRLSTSVNFSSAQNSVGMFIQYVCQNSSLLRENVRCCYIHSPDCATGVVISVTE